MSKILFIVAALVATGQVSAKLPAPTEEAKTKALETKAKAAWSDKVAAYQLCKAQDKVAALYMTAKGTEGKPAKATAPCQEPGPYVSPVIATSVTSAMEAAASPPVVTAPPKKIKE